MVMMACTVGMSVSILVYIIVFQYGLAYKLGWFPVQGWEGLRYAVLPVLIGLAVSIAPTLRLFRSFVLDEVGQDYVRTARAKGVSERRVMWVHVLRNAAIPILTYVMSNLPALLIGAFLLERFFGIPGIGREVILAVERSDFPVIKAITVYVAAATMLFNLLTDLLYQAVDPRVKLS
jgi:peptide/nickel transport system permease protein